MYGGSDIVDLEVYALCLLSAFLFIMLLILLAIGVQPRETIAPNTFHVRGIPLIPGISIFINIYLMLMLDMYTWIRFGIWMAIGEFYFSN